MAVTPTTTGYIGSSWLVQALSSSLGLRTLPPHADKIAISALFFTVLYCYLAEPLSRFFIPKQWAAFSGAEKADWKLRVVSLAQSIVLGPASIYVLVAQTFLWEPRGLIERVYGYYDFETQITNFALGYFLWHFAMMVIEYRKHGMQMVAHSVIGVGCMGGVYVPFTCSMTVWFLVYEVTNIPHNIYRFLARLGRGTSRASMLNASAWIVLFFVFRIIWGTYGSFLYLRDMFRVWDLPLTPDALGKEEYLVYQRLDAQGLRPQPIGDVVLMLTTLAAITLAGLNYVWFYLIVKTTLRRVSELRRKDEAKAE